MIPPDDVRRFFAEYFGMEPDAIPMGWTSMFDELAKAMEEMTKGIRGYLPAGPEVRGLLEGGDGGVMGLLGWDAPTEQELDVEPEVAAPEQADVPIGLARHVAAGMSAEDASHLAEMMRTPAQPRVTTQAAEQEQVAPEPTSDPATGPTAEAAQPTKSEWEKREDLDADLEEFSEEETPGAWRPRESGKPGMENANGEVAYDWKEENGLLVAEEDGETISGGRENFQDEADEALRNITEALPSVEGDVVYLQAGTLEPGKAPTKLVVFGESAQAIAGALDAANVTYRDNFDSIEEKMEEGKETRDGAPYDESHYKVTISGKKNVQAAIQALVGDNGDYGVLVLQDESGSLRFMLNPKTVDMEGVPTLEKARAENERLKQEIEEENRKTVAAWEARTGLKYDPDWRERAKAQEAPAEPSAQPAAEPVTQPELSSVEQPSAGPKFKLVREPVGEHGAYMEGIKENGHWVGEVKHFPAANDKLPAMIEHYDGLGRLERIQTMYSTDRSKVYTETFYYADGTSLQAMFAPNGDRVRSVSIDVNGRETILYSRQLERFRQNLEEAKGSKHFPKEAIDWELLTSDNEGLRIAEDVLFYVKNLDRQDAEPNLDKKQRESERRRSQTKLREYRKKALAKQEELQKRRGQGGNVVHPAPGTKDSWGGRPTEAIVQDIRSIRATPRKEHTSPLLKAGTFRQEDGSYRTVKNNSNRWFTVYQTLDGKRVGEEQEWERRFNDNKRDKFDDFLTLTGTTRYDDNGNPVEMLGYDPDGRIHGRERFRSWRDENGEWHTKSVDSFVIDEDGVYITREGVPTEHLPLDVLDESRGQAGNTALSVNADGKRYFRDADEVLEDFIKELDGVELNEEQRGIYDVVTKKKRETDIRKRDLKSIIKFRKGSRGKGRGKIINTHYAGLRNPVTAREVIDMGIVIRYGTLVKDGTDAHPTSYHYEYISPVDGAKLTLVVDRGKKGDEEVINYYSNRKVRNRGQEASSGSMTSSSENTISNPGGDVKPQPGLITIPPQNTALSVGDLHTGARVAYGKPDSKFIGSGEGAQVYGWGHYSSGVKGVARDEYAMRYVEDFQERSKVQYKGDTKSAVSIGGVVYDNVVDFAYEASRIEEAIHNKLQNHEKIEKDEEGNFVVGDKTVPKELLTFIAATRTALVDAQTVFSAWTGKAVPKDYRDPEFYRIARYRAKSEQDSVLPMSRFYGEMMLRGPLKSKKAWAAFVDSFFPKMERLKPEGPLPAVMTQTWWTHRPEGDESHLLNWFEPIEGDNREIVIRAIEGIASDYNWDDEVLDGEFGEDWRDREDLTGGEVYEGVANLIYKDTFDFEKSRQWASEGLYAHDIDGVKYPVDSYFNDDNRDGNKGWNYVAFSDEHLQVDSVEEWNPETLSFEPRPVPGNVAFSVGERPGRAPTVESGGDVREAGEGALAWLRRKFVHSQTPVFDAVRRVMGVGREPPDALNVEAAAKNVHGKIRARQEMLQRAYLEPLKAILAQPGMDRKRFDDYALALHALERNRMIQERSVVVDPTTGEVVDLGVEAGSGVTNAWAERVIREVQRDPFAAQYKEAANILAEMNRFVLRGAVADGLLTEAQARTWMRLSPHYVPLKSGGAAPGAIHKRATGRFTRPDSVLVNSMRQAYATVRNGELNRVNKTMADWIREYDPNGKQVGGTVPESHKHAKIKMAEP